MKISIVACGKIKEKYLQAGIAEFVKRLKPYCQLEFIEISEEKMPDKPSPAEKRQILQAEGAKLLQKIPQNSYVFLLDVYGKEFSSEELAAKLDELPLQGHSHFSFVIGGPFGLSEELRQRADQKLSFSRMTFTHQMVRLLLVEQIYRCFKINRGEKYHW